MNQTFVGCSLYHIYISILLAHKAKKEGKKSLLIVINDRVEDIEKLIPKINELQLFESVLSIKSYSILTDFKKNLGLFNYIFNREKGLVELFEKTNPILVENDFFIRNSEINLFHVVRTRAYFLIKYPNNLFRMVEEGLGTYLHRMPKSRYLKRKYLIKFPILMGYDKQVKEILVQHPENMKDQFLRNKSVKMDLNLLQQNLSEIEKKQLINCFLGDEITFSQEKKMILITQPLSEDGHLTENVKIKLYKKVVEKAISEGYKVYIKQHPRETTDYTKLLSDVSFIPKLFPIELLNLSKDFSFDLGFTFYSSSLENLQNIKKKVVLGMENLNKINDILDNDIDFI